MAASSKIFSFRLLSKSNFYRQTCCGGVRWNSNAGEESAQLTSKEKISRAMKAYLERAKAHEAFMEQETHNFNIGRRHLANMMGADADQFTQQDIDKSIEYLLPSGLFEKKARPLMKPPEQVFPKTKAAEFDQSGRPHHYLFYTTRPNFSTLLHEIADKLNELNAFEDKIIRQQQTNQEPQQTLNLLGSMWVGKQELEGIILERLVDVEFDKFTNAMERLASHPYAYRAADFIDRYRIKLMAEKKQIPIAEPQVAEDGRRFVEVKDCKRKNTIGSVKLTVPGTGKITINGHQGISYFMSDYARNQVFFYHMLLGRVHSVRSWKCEYLKNVYR